MWLVACGVWVDLWEVLIRPLRSFDAPSVLFSLCGCFFEASGRPGGSTGAFSTFQGGPGVPVGVSGVAVGIPGGPCGGPWGPCGGLRGSFGAPKGPLGPLVKTEWPPGGVLWGSRGRFGEPQGEFANVKKPLVFVVF